MQADAETARRRRDVVFNMAVMACNAVMSIMTSWILVRLLAGGAYGTFSTALATAVLANSVAFEWLRLSLLRNATVSDNREVLNAIRWLYAGAYAVFVAVVGTLALVLEEGSAPVVVSGGAAALALAQCDRALTLARALRQGTAAAVGQLVRGVGVFVLAALGAGATGDVTGALLGVALGNALSFALIGGRLPARWGGGPGWPTPPVVRRVVAFGVPMSATSAANMLLFAADRWVVATLMGQRDLTAYTAPADIAQRTMTPAAVSITLAGYPSAVHVYEQGDTRGAHTAIAEIGVLIFALLAPAVALSAVLRAPLAAILFPEDLRGEAALLLPVSAFALLVYLLRTHWADLAFQIARNSRAYIAATGVTLLAAVILLPLLVGRFGLVGAPVALAAANLLGLAAAVFLLRADFIVPVKTFLFTALAAVAAAGAASAAPSPPNPVQHILVASALGGLAYAAALAVLHPRETAGLVRMAAAKAGALRS